MKVAGIGFRAEATAAAIHDLLGDAQVDVLATLDRKAEALRGLIPGLPVVGVARAALAGVETSTTSARVLAEFGTGSLAEATALVAAGPQARLIVTRRISSDGMATAAIAEGQDG